MDADFSVELASDDERLEIPWAAPDGSCRYADLKNHPELIAQIAEAQREPILAEFLKAVNAPGSILQSAKCDAWLSDDISPEQEILGLPVKFGCYVDLCFCDERRFSFSAHELYARRITELLTRAPEIPTSAEFLIRRCHFHEGASERTGFYFTFYLFGFGNDEQSARRQWHIGLQLVENALRQAAR